MLYFSIIRINDYDDPSDCSLWKKIKTICNVARNRKNAIESFTFEALVTHEIGEYPFDDTGPHNAGDELSLGIVSGVMHTLPDSDTVTIDIYTLATDHPISRVIDMLKHVKFAETDKTGSFNFCPQAVIDNMIYTGKSMIRYISEIRISENCNTKKRCIFDEDR